jgi:hypothetical protein
MTPEAQRIAIAEACGWTNRAYKNQYGEPKTIWHHPDGTPIGYTPDYLRDLNAVHEAELELIYSRGLGMTYLAKLNEIVNAAHGFDYKNAVHIRRWSASATAAQRVETILRVTFLWKDEP